MFAPLEAQWRDLVARPAAQVENGEVLIPDGPGLGIELDEAELDRHPFVPRDLNLMDEDSILDRSLVSTEPQSFNLVE